MPRQCSGSPCESTIREEMNMSRLLRAIAAALCCALFAHDAPAATNAVRGGEPVGNGDSACCCERL